MWYKTPLPPPERVSPFRIPHAMTGGGVGPSVEPCPQLSLALLDVRKLGGIGKGENVPAMKPRCVGEEG